MHFIPLASDIHSRLEYGNLEVNVALVLSNNCNIKHVVIFRFGVFIFKKKLYNRNEQ